MSTSVEVTVNIVRNNYPPEFSPADYAQNVNFNIAVNEEIVVVDAQDRDDNVSNKINTICMKFTEIYYCNY